MKKLVSILMALVMILAIPMTSLAAEPVTIEFLFGDPNRTELFGRIVDDFNASHDDIQVSYTPSGLNHLEQLRTRLATNEVPDMTSQLQGMELKSYVEAGHIMNIKDESFMDYILPSETATVTVNDGVYGIPMDTQAWGVFYNKDLFAKAGITEVPKTVSELEEVVEKLKAAGITPFAAGFATVGCGGEPVPGGDRGGRAHGEAYRGGFGGVGAAARGPFRGAAHGGDIRAGAGGQGGLLLGRQVAGAGLGRPLGRDDGGHGGGRRHHRHGAALRAGLLRFRGLGVLQCQRGQLYPRPGRRCSGPARPVRGHLVGGSAAGGPGVLPGG